MSLSGSDIDRSPGSGLRSEGRADAEGASPAIAVVVRILSNRRGKVISGVAIPFRPAAGFRRDAQRQETRDRVRHPNVELSDRDLEPSVDPGVAVTRAQLVSGVRIG